MRLPQAIAPLIPGLRAAGDAPARLAFWFFDYLRYEGEPEGSEWTQADLHSLSLAPARSPHTP